MLCHLTWGGVIGARVRDDAGDRGFDGDDVLVSAMAWVAGESAQRTGALMKADQAFYAAEAGARRVQWYCTNGQMASITSPLTGNVNGYSYSASWSTVSGSTIQITSVGSTGNMSYSMNMR